MNEKNYKYDTSLAKSIRQVLLVPIFFFFYLEFFYPYCFILITGIVHKFKEFLKQRINSQ